MTVATKEQGILVNEGMGGFLNPPTHPEHDWSVETDLHKRSENRGRMSLSYAADCDYLSDATRRAATTKLTDWVRPKLGEPDIQAWILQVLGYFKSCYHNPDKGDKGWDAGNLIIAPDSDPMEWAEAHAGVHHIRKFYPSYEPTAEEFAAAKWGK